MNSPDTFTDELMLDSATRFAITWHGHLVHIERYDNHGSLLPDEKWVVVRHLFPLGSDVTNPHYLSGSVWRYKQASSYNSWREALNCLEMYAARPGTNGWAGIIEDPHAKRVVKKKPVGASAPTAA